MDVRLVCLLLFIACLQATHVVIADDGWSECTLTCGGGTQYRRDNNRITRYCNPLSCPGDAGCLSVYFSFDYAISNIIYDESHNGNLATIHGDAHLTDAGKFGKALNLTKYGNVTLDVENLHNRPTLAITIALWLKMSEVGGSHEIFFTCGNPVVYNVGSYHIGVDNGIVKWSLKDRDQTDLFSAAAEKPIEKDKWYHIAGTHRYSTRKASLYINGNVSKNTNAAPREFPLGIFNDWACADMGNPRDQRPLEGLIDEFYIFKCALLPEEISELYAKNEFKRFEIPRPDDAFTVTRKLWQKWINEEDIPDVDK